MRHEHNKDINQKERFSQYGWEHMIKNKSKI